MENLVTVICSFYQIDFEELKQPSKQRFFTHVRAVLAYFTNRLPSLSLAQLAYLLDRDPSGLSKSAFRLRIKLKEESDLLKEIQEIEGLLKKPSLN